MTVNKVESAEPWTQVTVDYTLGGLDADLEYKVAIDVTARGETRRNRKGKLGVPTLARS